MELFYGALNKKELRRIKRALSSFEIYNLNERIASTALSLVEIYSKSHGLKIPDALIAFTAIRYDMPLWTYNLKDFRFIENLKLI